MHVFKWTPTFNPWEESPIVPIWVRLPELPIQFFDREALFSIARLLGTPLRTDVSTATLVCPSVARVCIEINLLESLQTEIGLGFATEVFIQQVIYERLSKYCGTCKHLGHTEDECYEKLKSRGPARPVERDDKRAPNHADLRVKLDVQRAQRELHRRRKGKRVVFENVDGRPRASSSGAKGIEDGGVEVELHDMVLPTEMLEPMVHGEAVEGGSKKDIPVSQSTPDVCQGVEDVAICSSEPVVPEELLPQDGLQGVCVGQAESCVVPPALDPRVEKPVCVENLIPNTADVALCPPGEGILQTDTEDMTSRLARHQRGRSLADERGAHSVFPDRGKVVSSHRRIITWSIVRSTLS
ncbi:UNVERIFIED_CONTAM: hypothetical protein Sangu_1719500 [Sesamum angustifolium]|uniref:DUF4283 domain-containing protein n=1 Tax=Sesamum angustifolium TaxID=2727405 RepID=A0AAW2MJV8_9LAMI